jgi:hypothetical protein
MATASAPASLVSKDHDEFVSGGATGSSWPCIPSIDREWYARDG